VAVTPNDVAIETGIVPDITTEARWASWINRAERQIQRRADRLGILFSGLDPQTVDDVVLLAVSAHARNPEGVDTVDVSVDDGRVSRRYRKSAGEVSIYEHWWESLGLADDGAFTITAGEVISPPAYVMRRSQW
jgi:hypothetical protein